MTEALDRQTEPDPFGLYHIGLSIGYVLDVASDFPTYLPAEGVADICAFYLKKTKGNLSKVSADLWDRGLRQEILNYAHKLCDECTKCDLHKNRYPGRGSAPGDGIVDSKIFAVGEANGEFENRTKFPFSGKQQVLASDCTNFCKNFEKCYIEDDRFVSTPKAGCEYSPADIKPDLLKIRLKKREGSPRTAGDFLEPALEKAGVMRYSRYILRSEIAKLKTDKSSIGDPPRDIYFTNSVKCRPLENGKNGKPTSSEILACSSWTQIFKRLVKPSSFIAIGNYGLLGMDVTKTAGFKITDFCSIDKNTVPQQVSNRQNEKVWVCIHPAAPLYENSEERLPKWQDKISEIFKAAREEGVSG